MSTAPADDDRWQPRATRARRLANERPAIAELLHFYANLAEIQGAIARKHAPRALIAGATAFADQLDPGAILRALPEFLQAMTREAPDTLAERLPVFDAADHDRWLHRISTSWITGGREAWDADEIQRFAVEAILQPFAEQINVTLDDAAADSRACPRCTGTPVVAMLHEQGHGARRTLVCGFCLSEWPARRLICAACGESQFEALPVFRADDFDAVRLDACETCKTYLKTIDRTRDGDAMATVDDLATLPLDLWAQERGFRRIRPNLLLI